MRIRITIEYDPDWPEPLPEGVTEAAQLIEEEHDWLDGNVSMHDITATGGTVRFELIKADLSIGYTRR